MSSAICFNLDQSKIASSDNGLNNFEVLYSKSKLWYLQHAFSVHPTAPLEHVHVLHLTANLVPES